MGKFTWNDLAAAIEKLPAEQREKQVLVSIDDESMFRKIEDINQVLEDIYCRNDNDEDFSGIAQFKELDGDSFNIEDYRLVTPVGTIFLWDGF